MPRRKEMNDLYEEKWGALKSEIDGRTQGGEELFLAIKDYYEVYDGRLPYWLGSLYNAEIGGFHYSLSSRDNEEVTTDRGTFKLLPDIESSFQALSILSSSGMMKDFSELPEKMREGLKSFVCSLQDKDTGFIIHPQWRELMADVEGKSGNADIMWKARRGRDMMWAEGICERLGFSLPYPTAYERLMCESEGEKTAASSDLPDYLLSRERLINYLDSLNWETDAYYAGNMVASQGRLFLAAGLADIAADYLTEKQNKESGLWGSVGGYAAINAYLKITGMYNELKLPIPNAHRAAESVIACATTEERAATVCYQYNVWYSVRNILNSLRTYGGTEGEEQALEITRKLLVTAPAAIRKTKEKLLTFKKADGSFSYYPHGTADHSQGMPVAIKGSNEGDLNASVICTTGITGNIFETLGLREFMIPLFGEGAFDKFKIAAKM